jgi:hypothetical protein
MNNSKTMMEDTVDSRREPRMAADSRHAFVAALLDCSSFRAPRRLRWPARLQPPMVLRGSRKL